MTAVGAAHTACSTVALLVGAAVVALPKGTPLHRAAGLCYALAMAGVNVTALAIYRLFGFFGPFHVLALVSLATLIAGLLPAVLRRPRGAWPYYHAHFMSWSYVGLVAAAAAEVSVRLPLNRVIGLSFTAAVLIPTLAVVAAGGWLIARRVPGIVRTVRAGPLLNP